MWSLGAVLFIAFLPSNQGMRSPESWARAHRALEAVPGRQDASVRRAAHLAEHSPSLKLQLSRAGSKHPPPTLPGLPAWLVELAEMQETGSLSRSSGTGLRNAA